MQQRYAVVLVIESSWVSTPGRALLRNNFWQVVRTLMLSPSHIGTGVKTPKVATDYGRSKSKK